MNPTFLSSTSPSEGAKLEGGFIVTECVEDIVHAADLSLARRAYAAARADGQVITGSAAAIGRCGAERAFAELLERAATLAAIETPFLLLRTVEGEAIGTVDTRDVFRETGRADARFSRSNGVALAEDWETARKRATFELIERDAILRSWFGESRPVALDDVSFPATDVYTWRAVSLPLAPAWAAQVSAEVVFVCAFPRRSGVPLLRGSACRATLHEAIEAARGEALQSLAFLWSEEIPERAPHVAPTAIFHLDHYLCAENHGRLAAWLDGAHARDDAPKWGEAADPTIRWADVTPGGASYRVAVAWSAAAVPLIFGEWPALESTPSARAFGPHPIA